MPVLQVPAGEEGVPGGFPNLLKEEEQEEDEEEKKTDVAGWDQCGGTNHKREREGSPLHCNVCDKAFKSLQMPSRHQIWQHSGNVFVCKGCCKKFNPNNSINRHNKFVCGKIFGYFSMWGKDHH